VERLRLDLFGLAIRFVGHVIRKRKLEYLMLTGKLEGKRARGRQGLTFLSWLERSTDIKPLDLITKLQKRQQNDVVADVNVRILA